MSINDESHKIDYHDKSHLPIPYAVNDIMLDNQQVNLCILDEENQNLTPSQKLLLL